MAACMIIIEQLFVLGNHFSDDDCIKEPELPIVVTKVSLYSYIE